jgi:DNA-binding transcriptional LysR family regulator
MPKNKLDLNWDDLRVFVAVCREGTAAGASKQLNRESTTVARRIRKLEATLKVRLFKRTVAGYEPTPSASRLLNIAESMETAALMASTGLTEQDNTSRIVRIGAPDGFGSLFLAPRLRPFCESHPNIHVELVATARSFSLTKREADIAFSVNMPEKARVIARKLTDYQLRLYASTDYLRASRPIRDKADLVHHSFIGYIEELLFASELDYLPVIGKNTVVRFKSSNLIAQLQACISGAGLAVLPVFAAHEQPALRPVLPDEISIMRSFYMQTHEDSRNVRWIREAADFIVQAVRSNRHLFVPPT